MVVSSSGMEQQSNKERSVRKFPGTHPSPLGPGGGLDVGPRKTGMNYLFHRTEMLLKNVLSAGRLGKTSTRSNKPTPSGGMC
jgi:hypothetical protein